MGRRSDIDWDAVQVDYSLGSISVREIARKHRIAESNLRAKAQRERWPRGDGEAVRVATRAALTAVARERAQQIGAEIGAQRAQQFDQELERATLSATEVLAEHQRAARRGMDVASELLQYLEEAALCGDREQLVAIRTRVDTLDKWAAAVAKLSAVERGAHGIGNGDQRNAIDDLLLRVATERASRQ